jgi:hypothetical protein
MGLSIFGIFSIPSYTYYLQEIRKSHQVDPLMALSDGPFISKTHRIHATQSKSLAPCYAVELGEVGRSKEALEICRITLASPFAFAYPEWLATRDDLIMRGGYRIPRPFKAVEPHRVQPADVVSLPIGEKTSSNSPVDEPGKLLLFRGRAEMADQAKEAGTGDITQKRREIVDFLYKYGDEIGSANLDTFLNP